MAGTVFAGLAGAGDCFAGVFFAGVCFAGLGFAGVPFAGVLLAGVLFIGASLADACLPVVFVVVGLTAADLVVVVLLSFVAVAGFGSDSFFSPVFAGVFLSAFKSEGCGVSNKDNWVAFCSPIFFRVVFLAVVAFAFVCELAGLAAEGVEPLTGFTCFVPVALGVVVFVVGLVTFFPGGDAAGADRLVFGLADLALGAGFFVAEPSEPPEGLRLVLGVGGEPSSWVVVR